MKLPQKPPDTQKILLEQSEKFTSALSNHAFMAFTQQCEKAYLHWDELRYKTSGGIDPALVWTLIKVGRSARYHQVSLFGSNKIPLKYNLPDSVQQELMMIDQQLAGSLATDDQGQLTTSQRDRFIVSALQEEAIASSMLEGAATTRREAKEMLDTGRKPKGRGEQMVLNNYRAILWIREHRDAVLSPEFLLELQSILTHQSLDQEDEVGRFRTTADEIVIMDQRDNEVIHTPPPAGELKSRLKALCRFGNQTDDSGFIHPVIRACILHFQIGFDHPFCDGNGRTARALFYWSMLKNGYWLFEYLPISRFIYKSPVQYTRAYLHCETDDYDLTYFLMYQFSIFQRARNDLKKYLDEKRHQVVQAKELFISDSRLNHRQREVLMQITSNPGLRLKIAIHQNRQNITYETARTDLQNLAAWGYLKMTKVGNRHEFLAGPKVIELGN